MKKIALILMTMIIGFNCSSKNGATINFPTKIHDFGQISEESKTVSYSFQFKNEGNGPLVIHKAIASCGCTTPEYPKAPIASGASGTIKVTYNTVNRPGAFHKTITVYTNDPDAPNVVLVIKGTVSPKNLSTEETYPKDMQGLRLMRNQLNMLDARIGSVLSETINFINTNKTPINLSFNKLPKHIQVTATNKVLQPNETGYLTIKYTPSLANDYGKREDSFYVVTNPKDKENPDNKISVSSYIAEDFSRLSPKQRQNAPKAFFSENRINLGTMSRNTHKIAAISLTNQGNSSLIIRKIIPEYDGIKVTLEKKDIKAGKTIKVKIDFNSGTFNGNVLQRISFITNDPQNSVSRVFLTAQVTEKK